MLQYLLNTTAIWLLSLVMFDMLLRKEAFHSYNRVYLLFTFLLGILLPLWKWKPDTSLNIAPAIGVPMHRATIVKQLITQQTDRYVANATLPAHHSSFNWLSTLVLIYIIGAVIAFTFLIIELVKLLKLLAKGSKTLQDKWMIIETGHTHAPCSILNYIIVGNKQQYNAEEWDTIIEHEKRHGNLLHFADLLLVQFAKIIFWFHPLVYLFERRLLLVHEYQADQQVANSPVAYGQFLVNQSMLQNSSSLSHSLTRSPIKNRIFMLTKRSSQWRLLKLIILIPVLLCSMVCFTQNTFSDTRKISGDKVYYKGNVFVSSLADTEIAYTQDSATTLAQMNNFPQIVKMNGAPVYSYLPAFTYSAAKDPDLAHAIVAKTTYQFYKCILDSTISLLTQLDDGFYSLAIYNPIIDEKGHLAYYEDDTHFWSMFDTLMGPALTHYTDFANERAQKGILIGAPRFWWKKDNSQWDYLKIDPKRKDAIDKKIYTLLENMPPMDIVYQSGKAVPYRLEAGTKYGGFDIKNHHFAIIPVSNSNY